ncbi:inactive protein RESTRICTED TEV MOVEMENT 2 [Lactuca sativa]|uniref:inactive protein RESTRICTED TEV MOVEMENT 2 n=1 Tax=Lactuca sativa TaxID=4236 RepID=UPI000CAAAC52|nr:inactive protein RESTRICTED TEV MOVEMENT 2 [Lactuca sativa]
MDSKVGGTQLQKLLSYDEFEPMCTWQREDGQDVLVLHLPEFKKDQLRIQISNTGILKITGENVVDGKRRNRFLKEIKVTKDYDSNNIHAKFSQGRLRVTMPKKVPTPTTMESPSAAAMALPQDNQNDTIANTNGKTSIIPNIRARVGKVVKSKEFSAAMVNVGFVVVAAFSIYVAYNYWTSYVRVDED